VENLKPHICIIAGPNGSGKSTCGPAILQNHLQVSKFVNADTIAAGLSAFQPAEVALEASRIMLNRLKELAERRENFAFETTLSSRSFAPWIARLQESGYHFSLVYFWLQNERLAVARVAERVRLGGHGIPENVIKRRFTRSLLNFFTLYQPLADEWCVYDNSEANNVTLVARGKRNNHVEVHREDLWHLIIEQRT
jgi:predicted ABC-type ATPase